MSASSLSLDTHTHTHTHSHVSVQLPPSYYTLHVHFTKPSNVRPLSGPKHPDLEQPLATLDPPVPDLHEEPQVSAPPNPVPLRGPCDIQEDVGVEVGGGEEVVRKELKTDNAETEERGVRERDDEPWEVVGYGRVGRRGSVCWRKVIPLICH